MSSFKIVSGDAVHQPTWPLLLKIEHMVKLQVFGNNSKTCNFTICSIFSNSGHVGWSARSSDITCKGNPLRMIQAKFGLNWPSGFRGEDF